MKKPTIVEVFCDNGKTAIYTSSEEKIIYILKTFASGDVQIICDVPDNWAVTRVCQFMESLLSAEFS